ncbi:hypothetical protein ATO6_12030 [Oceanicola sp. 22II-s10i]|uniref:hypothetical protein n=1 Tax=Oceanicola sp. 22II-s10i TaxID=1317116 RepID=UPI000B526D24|nr:hypothetical protein [Oceanicola sp. 22II-s10i]OWU84428.1 hypothetical protein ATO6_12030 [Oceanicola sp. 22II-s10i]
MRRAATLVTAITIATASAAWAAYSSLPMNDLTRPDPGSANQEILIRVAPEDLSRCIATLMQVMQPPVDSAFVADVKMHGASGPTARCVAE